MTSHESFRVRALAAVAAGDRAQLKASGNELDDAWLRTGSIDGNLFTAFLEVLGSPTLMNSPYSHEFLLGVDAGWDGLSDDQRKTLIPVLQAGFREYRDWMSWFLVSELLGERYRNDAALHVLRDLKEIDNETARSLIPHGFAHLAASAAESGLAHSAYRELAAMAHDPSQKVRREAEASLANLRKHVNSSPGHALRDVLKDGQE